MKNSKNFENGNTKNRAIKGITLIALIVTIIILLILAGITIHFALENNGILRRAEYAVDEYQNEVEQEKSEFAKIDDYIENSRSNNENKNNYSTNEQVIGTWIDGKPIYRRVFIFIGPSKINETTILYEEKSTIDTIVSLDGYQKFTNGGGAPINARMNNSSQWGLTVWCNPNYNGNMDIRAHTDSSGFTNSTINLVLEYTKTTD